MLRRCTGCLFHPPSAQNRSGQVTPRAHDIGGGLLRKLPRPPHPGAARPAPRVRANQHRATRDGNAARPNVTSSLQYSCLGRAPASKPLPCPETPPGPRCRTREENRSKDPGARPETGIDQQAHGADTFVVDFPPCRGRPRNGGALSARPHGRWPREILVYRMGPKTLKNRGKTMVITLK